MKAILIGLLGCLSLVAHAQTPTTPPLPNYVVTIQQQAVDAINEGKRLKLALMLTQDSLARCRWVLDTTRRNRIALDKLRLIRIDSVTAEATRKFRAEYEQRVAAEVRAETADQRRINAVKQIADFGAQDGWFRRRKVILRIVEAGL